MLLAQSLAAQKKYKEAITKYDEVLAGDAGGDKRVEREKQAACSAEPPLSLAQARWTSRSRRFKMIDSATGDDDLFYARAYNALGSCYRMAGQNKEALLAFLHTDLLYSQYAEEDAEALANLARLWTDLNQGNRGAATLRTLKDKYPYSTSAQNR